MCRLAPAEDRRAGRLGPVRAGRQQGAVRGPGDLAEAAAGQSGDIRSGDTAQLRNGEDIDIESVVSDREQPAVRRERHRVRMSTARRLYSRQRAQIGAVEADAAIKGGSRQN